MAQAKLEVQQTQKMSQSMTTALRLLSFDLTEMSEYMTRQIQENPSLEYVPPVRSPQDFVSRVRIHYSASMDDPDRDPGETAAPETAYADMHPPFDYTHAAEYGYVDFEKREYHGERVFTADEYVAFCGTHCDHIVIPEPDKSKLFSGLREAVLEAGNRIVFQDTYVLYLAKKPQYD